MFNVPETMLVSEVRAVQKESDARLGRLVHSKHTDANQTTIGMSPRRHNKYGPEQGVKFN